MRVSLCILYHIWVFDIIHICLRFLLADATIDKQQQHTFSADYISSDIAAKIKPQSLINNKQQQVTTSNNEHKERWSLTLQFFVRNLAYVETPQYLRKSLFSVHPSLRMSGLQNPLDAPHHLRINEWLPYRFAST